MTLSRDQFHERMIEYLYGELEGAELRAFEAQLRASEDDRREVLALQAALGSVREGLAHASDEAPPARVRQAVLAAAAQHAPRARTPRWLRTSFVVVPALAVAAAALLVVLGKKIEAPRVHVDEAEARSQLEPAAPPPSAAAPAVADAVDDGASQSESEAPSAGAARAPGTGAAPSPPSAAAPAKAARRGAADTAFAQPPAAWKRERQPPSAAERSPAPERDALLDRSANAAPAPAAQATRGGAPEDFATPEAKVGRARPASAAESAREEREPSAAKGAPPPSADKARADKELSVGSVSAAAETAAPATPAAARFPASTTALERRARDHVTAQRWREAAIDYRELLRREPGSSRAAEWKKQLTLATRARQRSK